jgi:antitoxin component HigA of HigAB toxin-antitoxin module
MMPARRAAILVDKFFAFCELCNASERALFVAIGISSQSAETDAVLIQAYEETNYRLKPASPVEVVRHLMHSNGLKQADLIDVFGSASIVSEVLNKKRKLSKTHIEKLSRRFHVSPEVFFAVTAKG